MLSTCYAFFERTKLVANFVSVPFKSSFATLADANFTMICCNIISSKNPLSQISGSPPSQKCHSAASAAVSEHCTKLHCTITQFRCSNVKNRMNVYVCASCNILATIIANIFVLKKGCVRCTRNLWNFDYYHHLYVPSTQCKYHLCKLCHFDDHHQLRKRHHCPAHLWPPTNPREGLLHYSLLPNIAKHINWPFVQIVQMSKFPNVSMPDKKNAPMFTFMKGNKCPNCKMLQC